jgi:hypothetical protein
MLVGEQGGNRTTTETRQSLQGRSLMSRARALSTQVNLLVRHFGLFALRSYADEFLWNIKA